MRSRRCIILCVCILGFFGLAVRADQSVIGPAPLDGRTNGAENDSPRDYVELELSNRARGAVAVAIDDLIAVSKKAGRDE